MERIKLKRGKESIVQFRHHWIFSGALEEKRSDLPAGTIVEVVNHQGGRLGEAFYNAESSIALRMLSFGAETAAASVPRLIQQAVKGRQKLFPKVAGTNAYRLINGEGDGLPALIVDRYDTTLVIQSGTAGMDLMLPEIIKNLRQMLPEINCIYEKSDSAARTVEKLPSRKQFLIQDGPLVEVIEENGVKFALDVLEGQKTGLFLDQREMRSLVEKMSQGRKVLNCFAYQGGFSLYAGRGGATLVDSVDVSMKAVSMIEKNLDLNRPLNKISAETSFSQVEANVFQFLRQENLPNAYDFIILDPPAFAKKKEDEREAFKAYKDINRLSMKHLPSGGLLLSCSCSHFMPEKELQKAIFLAALEAKREVRILSRHLQAKDHPVNLFHPETEYLKSFLLQVF